jgi:hypothetical protein
MRERQKQETECHSEERCGERIAENVNVDLTNRLLADLDGGLHGDLIVPSTERLNFS